MQTRLRETGQWLRTNGEAIYDTTYWSKMAELGDDIRFTVRPNRAFYIHSLTQPGSRLTVEAPVPIRNGDTVTTCGVPSGYVVGGPTNGQTPTLVDGSAQCGKGSQ